MRTVSRLSLLLSSAALAGVTACTPVVADTSACRAVSYSKGFPSRAEYLPCVSEMMAALQDLDRQTEAALAGDGQARADGKDSLRRVRALMQAAGGRQLLERWDDHVLTGLNVDIHNAVTHYDAFYMVRILDKGNQFADQSRDAARAEYVNANRRYDEARRTYQRIK